jgi:hypothetical protein
MQAADPTIYRHPNPELAEAEVMPPISLSLLLLHLLLPFVCFTPVIPRDLLYRSSGTV